MSLSKEYMVISEDKYKVQVEHRRLGKRAAIRLIIFGNALLLFGGLLAILFSVLPVSYTLVTMITTSVIFSTSIYFDRKGRGATGVFAITHNTVEIGVSFRNLNEPWDTPNASQFRLIDIQEISYNPDKSRIIFHLIGEKRRSFPVSDDIPSDVVERMLIIATKNSGTPYRISSQK